MLPVVSKGYAGDVENIIITTRGNSNHAATKGEPKESTGTEWQSQQKSSAPNKKQTGSEKKSHQVSTSQMTSTSGGARGVEKTKDVIDPKNIATYPFFYGTKFVQLNLLINLHFIFRWKMLIYFWICVLNLVFSIYFN